MLEPQVKPIPAVVPRLERFQELRFFVLFALASAVLAFHGPRLLVWTFGVAAIAYLVAFFVKNSLLFMSAPPKDLLPRS